MEFATQPYDVSRRDTVTLRSMFETAGYRCLAGWPATPSFPQVLALDTADRL